MAQARARHELIVKACGLLKAPGLAVFDATAGLFARRGRSREDGLRMQQRLRDEWSSEAPRAKR